MSALLDRLLGATPCACGRCGPVPTARAGVTDDLAAAVREELGGARAVLLGDPRTLAACGRDLAAWLEASGTDCRVVDLETPGSRLRADEEAVSRARDALESDGRGAVAVAVGSGTVHDVVKAACHELGRPYLGVATAASVNGYTSSIAAITVGGLKGTRPTRPPTAVLASSAVLAASPVRMSVSGLADLLSKPVSSADWRLSHILWDDPYCPTPVSIAEEAVRAAAGAADRLSAGDRRALEVLLEALLASGIAMTVAGTSSPASGGEHLVSHFLDMTAGCDPAGPREPALHGEQVGLGTAVSTRLYRKLLGRRERDVDWDGAARAALTPEGLRERLEEEAWLPGELLQRLLEQGSSKLRRLGPPAHRIRRIRERWGEIARALAPDLETAEAHLDLLRSAGAPGTASDLGVAAESFRRAVRLARWVGDRYTILDLAGDLGLAAELESDVLAGLL